MLKRLNQRQEEDEHIMKIRNEVAEEDPEAAEEESRTCVIKKTSYKKKHVRTRGN